MTEHSHPKFVPECSCGAVDPGGGDEPKHSIGCEPEPVAYGRFVKADGTLLSVSMGKPSPEDWSADYAEYVPLHRHPTSPARAVDRETLAALIATEDCEDRAPLDNYIAAADAILARFNVTEKNA